MEQLTREERNGHRGITIWLTGLSGAGKSTIAKATEAKLFERNVHIYVLDGDVLRAGINKDLGFTAEDRKENIRRVSEMCKGFNNTGFVVIAALISPYTKDRSMARTIIGDERFAEIYINASIDCCIQRDPKGLYKKAIAGDIPNFTGISDVYEPPAFPALTLETEKESIEVTVEKLTAFIQQKIVLP